MIPNTGGWAKYTFINKMDALNGIYQVTSIESFEDTISNAVDYVTLLYTPAGLTKTDWLSDYDSYKNQDVIWLQPTDSSKAKIPVPVSIVATIPDLNVNIYRYYSLLVPIGLYDTVDALKPLADQINDLVSATTGETSNVIWTASQKGAIYKTIEDYTVIDQARKAKAKNLLPLITQLYEKNQEIDDLKAKVNYLEQALIEAVEKQ